MRTTYFLLALVLALALAVNICQAKHEDCIPKCARKRFPHGLQSSCLGVRGLVAAWYADKMDAMRANLSAYPVLSDGFICTAEAILSGDPYYRAPIVTSNWTLPPRISQCSTYQGSYGIENYNNWEKNAGIAFSRLSTQARQINQTGSCSLTGPLIWLNATCNTATCITFYRLGTSPTCVWPVFLGKPPRSGDTYCKSDVADHGCGTAHGNLYAELTGHCPLDDPSEELVMSGGSVCNSVYSGHSNTFNNGNMPWANVQYYDGYNNRQDPQEFLVIIGKALINNQLFVDGNRDIKPLYSYNTSNENNECPCIS